MKYTTQNPQTFSKRVSLKAETQNLGDHKSVDEIYGTVFKPRILIRKIYLNRIGSQGA